MYLPAKTSTAEQLRQSFASMIEFWGPYHLLRMFMGSYDGVRARGN